MTTPRLLVHTSMQPIRWGDMDALGHVNNTSYFRYMEQARIEWLYAQSKADGAPGEGPVIVNASCNFLKPLVYPADVEVRMYLGHPGRSSVVSYYDLAVAGKKYADGAAKMVWVDFASGRPMLLPQQIAEPLRALTAGSDS
ncbi:MAG: thioesterase family protein [Casimicrobiaceae bacterium]